jgi:hypothetical protein
MIFNFFKKEHKYAELVFETFGPTLKLIKLQGKWDEKKSTFGDILISDKYLLGYIQAHITLFGIKLLKVTDNKDYYNLLHDCFKKIDGTFAFAKFDEMIKNYGSLYNNKDKELVQGQADAGMVFNVMFTPGAENVLKTNSIYKEAANYVASKDFKNEKDLFSKITLDTDNTPSINNDIAMRIYQNTFVKRLNKVFKVQAK